MVMDLRIVFILALGLAGCASSQTVYLQNTQGEQVQCGPYTNYGNIASASQTAQRKLRYCIEDFQSQGYVRIPNPE